MADHTNFLHCDDGEALAKIHFKDGTVLSGGKDAKLEREE